jgi:hypothetical protein
VVPVVRIGDVRAAGTLDLDLEPVAVMTGVVDRVEIVEIAISGAGECARGNDCHRRQDEQ